MVVFALEKESQFLSPIITMVPLGFKGGVVERDLVRLLWDVVVMGEPKRSSCDCSV